MPVVDEVATDPVPRGVDLLRVEVWGEEELE